MQTLLEAGADVNAQGRVRHTRQIILCISLFNFLYLLIATFIFLSMMQ